ncbi:auxin-responsive protein SAUR64 [Citrus sinensis]|nr:auxin-responsive protein SAUR64 [Citrus sinensis]
MPLSFLIYKYMTEVPLLQHHITISSYQEISSLELLVQLFTYWSIMINSKRLVQLARKWQKIVATKRKRISFPRSVATQKSSVANKGHFVVYTTDNTRFTVPLEYPSRSVFIELLRMSEEEFGLPSDGPITLPCDSTFFKYVMSLVKGCIPEDLVKALLTSLSTCRLSASSSLGVGHRHRHTVIYGY